MNITNYIAKYDTNANKIAEEAGVDGSLISRWRSGENEPMKSRVEPLERWSNGEISFDDVYQEFLAAQKRKRRKEAKAKRKGRAA